MNALKKVVSWLLALIMVLSMATTVAFAGEIMAVFTLESPKDAVKAGDTFTIPISITENKTIGSITLDTKWDSETFRLDKIDFSNKEVFADAVTGGNTANGRIIITQPGVSDATGLLAELTFTVLDAAKAGDYTITVVASELYDYDLNDLDCSIVPASVTVAGDEQVSGAKIVVGYTEGGVMKYNEIDDNRLVLQAGSQFLDADYNWPLTESLYVLDANGNVIEDIDWDLDDHSQIWWYEKTDYPLTASYAQVRGSTDGAEATLTATLPDESTVSIKVATKTYVNTAQSYNVVSKDSNNYSSSNKTLIIDKGATFTLSATKLCKGQSGDLTEAQIANNPVTFASDDESILTVNAQTGEYTVVGEGVTTIYMCVAGQLHGKNTTGKLKELNVYCGGAYAQELGFSKDGVVLAKDHPVANAFGTIYNYAKISVAVGETQEIKLATVPAAAIGNIKVSSVSSGSTANVTVKNENGTLKITGVAETETPIAVKVSWKQTNVPTQKYNTATTIYVDVTAPEEVEVTGVSVEPTALPEMEIDATANLTATVFPENATDKTVIWASSNEAVATVDQNGTVTAVAAGSATITATAANGVKGSCAVTVKAAETVYLPSGVVVDIEANDVGTYVKQSSYSTYTTNYAYVVGEDDIGFTIQGTAVVKSKDNTETGLATDQTVTWEGPEDETIASITEDGRITWNGGYGSYRALAHSNSKVSGVTQTGNLFIYFTSAIVSSLTAKVADENGDVPKTKTVTANNGDEVTAYVIKDGDGFTLSTDLTNATLAENIKWTVKKEAASSFTNLVGVNNKGGASLTVTADNYSKYLSASSETGCDLMQISASVPAYMGGPKSSNVTSATIYVLLVDEVEEPVVTINEDHADMNVSAENVTEGEKVQLLLSIENDENASSKYNSYEFHVSYDAELLSYESVSCGDGENCAVTEATKGALVINGYGSDKTVSEDAFVTLTFKANQVSETTDTDVKLTAAYRDTSVGAIDTDIDAIKVETSAKTVTIENKKATYKVSFSETVKVNGENVTETTVTEGESATFNVIEKTGHDFTVSGATKNSDGSYTVTPTCDTTVTITYTAKTYTVTVEGSGKDDVTAAASATYGTAYAFTLNKDDSYNYTVSVKVGGQTVGTTESNGAYTIAANDVTGDITITVSKEAKPPVKTEYTVTFYENGVANATTEKATEGEAYSKAATEGYKIYKVVMNGTDVSDFTAQSVSIASVTGNIDVYMGAIYTVTLPEDGSATGEGEANYGSDYTFTVSDDHQPKATVGGQEVELTENEDGSFTIAGTDITGEIVITTEKISYVEAVNVYDYVKSENATLIQLVVATAKEGALNEGECLQFNGANMFWSEAYNGYAYLVAVSADEDKLTADTAAASIGKATAVATSISYAGDVNKTGNTDINDAQLIYDIYKALYNDFSTVSMEKMLRADMNADHEVNVSDARAVAAIVNR